MPRVEATGDDDHSARHRPIADAAWMYMVVVEGFAVRLASALPLALGVGEAAQRDVVLELRVDGGVGEADVEAARRLGHLGSLGG